MQRQWYLDSDMIMNFVAYLEGDELAWYNDLVSKDEDETVPWYRYRDKLIQRFERDKQEEKVSARNALRVRRIRDSDEPEKLVEELERYCEKTDPDATDITKIEYLLNWIDTPATRRIKNKMSIMEFADWKTAKKTFLSKIHLHRMEVKMEKSRPSQIQVQPVYYDPGPQGMDLEYGYAQFTKMSPDYDYDYPQYNYGMQESNQASTQYSSTGQGNNPMYAQYAATSTKYPSTQYGPPMPRLPYKNGSSNYKSPVNQRQNGFGTQQYASNPSNFVTPIKDVRNSTPQNVPANVKPRTPMPVRQSPLIRPGITGVPPEERTCFACNRKGHEARNCGVPVNAQRNVSKGGPKPCFCCKSVTHATMGCPDKWCDFCRDTLRNQNYKGHTRLRCTAWFAAISENDIEEKWKRGQEANAKREQSQNALGSNSSKN
jgi:hypothetical protein